MLLLTFPRPTKLKKPSPSFREKTFWTARSLSSLRVNQRLQRKNKQPPPLTVLREQTVEWRTVVVAILDVDEVAALVVVVDVELVADVYVHYRTCVMFKLMNLSVARSRRRRRRGFSQCQ